MGRGSRKDKEENRRAKIKEKNRRAKIKGF